MTPQTLIQGLLRAGVASVDTVLGCTESEIRALERAQGIVVPAFFREWLLLAGKCAGAHGTISNYYPDILNNKTKAIALLNLTTRGKLHLPDDAMVFCYSGEEFGFFKCGDSSLDAQCWFFHVDEERFQLRDNFWRIHELDLETEEKVVTPFAIERARKRMSGQQSGVRRQ